MHKKGKHEPDGFNSLVQFTQWSSDTLQNILYSWSLILLWVHLEMWGIDFNFSGSEFMAGLSVVVLRLKTI